MSEGLAEVETVLALNPGLFPDFVVTELKRRAAVCTHTFYSSGLYSRVIEVGDHTTDIIRLVVSDEDWNDWTDTLGVDDVHFT